MRSTASVSPQSFKPALIKRIADELIAAKGVKHGKLTVTSSGKDLPS